MQREESARKKESEFSKRLNNLRSLAEKVEMQFQESEGFWQGEAADEFYEIFREEYQEMTLYLERLHKSVSGIFKCEEMSEQPEAETKELPGDFLK